MFPDDALLRERALHQLDRLDQLGDLGLTVSRAVARRAEAAGADEDLGALAMAYSRAARAVRQTVMLHDRLIKSLQDWDKAAIAAFDDADTLARNNHKARVERIVERAARNRHGEDDDAIDRLVTEAAERLDDEDLYGEVLNRSVADLVAEICRDLGLEPDWPEGAEALWSLPVVCRAAPELAPEPKPASERDILRRALADLTLVDSS
jgi:hypothetical protein